LHGYYSDLTRTFALPDSHIPTQALEKWFLVQTAQQAAAGAAKEGALASDVDAAARNVIGGKGLGKWFTHRLGHGEWSVSQNRPSLYVRVTQVSDYKCTKHRIYAVVTTSAFPSGTPFRMSQESIFRAR